ncbi:hypothetical protein ABFB09_04290, partial [Dehalogenimonas sp. THU2]|uniref:hypothetical protein n=1 Tax=Dehalogenimonas sp. THU2 TaxID=3151121 RepID=UPI003218316C
TSLLFCGFDEENAGRGAGGTPYHGFTTLMIRETTNHEFTPLDGTLPCRPQFLNSQQFILRLLVINP